MEKEAEEDNQYRQQLEQERRDHELAMRLAQESNSQVDDSPLLMRKYEIFDTKFILIVLQSKTLVLLNGTMTWTHWRQCPILHMLNAQQYTSTMNLVLVKLFEFGMPWR